MINNSPWTVAKKLIGSIEDSELAYALIDTCEDFVWMAYNSLGEYSYLELSLVNIDNEDIITIIDHLKDSMLGSATIRDFRKLLEDMKLHSYDELQVYL